MTLSDKRDALFSMLKDFPPDVQQALSVLDPINIEEIFELLQIPGFESAIKDQKEKTLADIEQLLQAQPTPGQPGPDGTPGPPQPSLPPDPFDNHALVSGVVGKWLVSQTGQETRKGNANGFANVQAFQQAHQLLAAPPPPPPPPPPLKGSLAWSGKLEDFPNLTPQILEAAGVQPPAPPPSPTPGPMPPPSPGAPPDMGPPAPPGAPPPVAQTTPMPPLAHPPLTPAPPLHPLQ
jgi:hypothetical protein